MKTYLMLSQQIDENTNLAGLKLDRGTEHHYQF